MRIRKFIADNTKDALLQVREEMGPQAIILKTKKIKEKTLLGFGGKEKIEVTAALDEKLFAMPETEKPQASNKLSNLKTYDRGGNNVSSTQEKSFSDEKFRLAEIHEDVEEVKSVLRDLANHLQCKEMPPLPQKITEVCIKLINNEVRKEIAIKTGIALQASMTPKEAEDMDKVTQKAVEFLAEQINSSGPFKLKNKRATRIMFIGPTGSGKTTTLAKLAAQYGIIQKMRVRIITADTYRIAAVEQIKTFAEIADIPVEVAFTAKEMRQMITKMSASSDLILIDTAGRSQNNKEHMEDIKDIVDAVEPDELHLVMSCTTKLSDLYDIVDKYRLLGVNRYLFTKTDETSRYGTILNLLATEKMPFSYLTTGQSVPDDIEEGSNMHLATMVVGSTKEDM